MKRAFQATHNEEMEQASSEKSIPPLWEAAIARNYEEFEELLGHGANINEPINQETIPDARASWTLLHYATWSKDTELFEYLLKHKPNVDVQEDRGVTPLQMATTHTDVPKIKALIGHWANPHIEGYMDMTAKDLNHSKEIETILTEYEKRYDDMVKRKKISKIIKKGPNEESLTL